MRITWELNGDSGAPLVPFIIPLVLYSLLGAIGSQVFPIVLWNILPEPAYTIRSWQQMKADYYCNML